jgi:hypothetical protein
MNVYELTDLKTAYFTSYYAIYGCPRAVVKKRFANVFSDDDAKLAAVITPKFKLDWIDRDSDTQSW